MSYAEKLIARQAALEHELGERCTKNLNYSLSGPLNEEEDETTVPEQCMASIPYLSQTCKLITSLLPMKQQMLNEMLCKKKKFLSRNINGELSMLSSCQPYQKFKDNKEQGNNMESRKVDCQRINLRQQIPDRQAQWTNSNQKSIQSNEKQIKSQRSRLKESIHSTNNQQNNQLMLKLLNIIQQERQEKTLIMSRSHMLPMGTGQKERENPIIINNIMKSPIQTLNREFIEKQIRIKMLEEQRNRGYVRARLKKDQDLRRDYCRQKTLQTEQAGKYVPIAKQNYESRSQAQAQKYYSQPVESQNVLETKIADKSVAKQERIDPAKPKEEIELKQYQGASLSGSYEEEETKNITPEITLVRFPTKCSLISHAEEDMIKREQFSQTSFAAVRRPVLFQIPVHDDNMSGLSLAQAFKRKIGKLSSEKSRKYSPNKQFKMGKQHHTIQLQRYSEDVKYQSAIVTPKEVKMRSNETQKRAAKSTQQKPEKISKEPSKELMDRLTFGCRAIISKDEMYALTRKNYQKLPQVLAKRKQQEKKEQELERLRKIREYQKMLRSYQSVRKQSIVDSTGGDN